MIKKYISVAISSMALLLSSCISEMTPSELFEETASGSVMILNKYYYQLRLPDGEYLYFSGLDENGNLENVTMKSMR